MVQLDEEFFFIHNWVDRAFTDDTGFRHLLHGVELFFFTLFNFPDLSKATAADYILEVEVDLGYDYRSTLELDWAGHYKICLICNAEKQLQIAKEDWSDSKNVVKYGSKRLHFCFG